MMSFSVSVDNIWRQQIVSYSVFLRCLWGKNK